jgi:alpha-galactosidase
VTRQWTLRTATTAYSVGVDLDGTALLLLGWGPAEESDPLPWSRPAGANTSWELDADLAPVEHASSGTRQLARPDLLVDHGDGLVGVRWAHHDSTVEQDDEGSHLTVRFRDTTGTVRLDLHTRTSAAHDVVRRWSEVHNVSDHRRVVLRRAMTGGWCVAAPHGARLHYLSGRWAHEFVPRRVDLQAGELSIGSRQGITSHGFTPWVTAQPLSEHGEPDRAAGAYSATLAWSGSWQLVAEAQPSAGVVRLSLGLADDALAVPLGPADSLRCPEMLGLWTPLGPDEVSRLWHQYARAELSRSTGPEHRPVVYNSWYATTFDVRAEHQLDLADVAAELGAEVFVVDDGWFLGRDTDTRGLGDWTPDPAALPEGLGSLAREVHTRGLRFGLWIEPECVNPDSDLYRAHPDWVYRAGDRPVTTMRSQLVLDLGRTEVVEWVEETLRRLLSSHPISYLKWDMNRPVTDGGRPGDPRSGRWSVDHAAGYLRVMTMLRREFPDVTVEACAGGGGRIDPAVLALSDVVWTSDETGPRDRLVIQDGFLRAYPPHVMSSWVTDRPDTKDTRPTSLEYRFVVAMAGVLGIGADLLQWSPEQRKTATGLVELYKSVRPVVHEGVVYRVGDPRAGLHSVQYDGADRHGGRIVVLVWDGRVERPAGRTRVRVPAARHDRAYRLPDGKVLSGAALARHGVEVSWSLAADADVIVLDPLPRQEMQHDA